MNPLEQRVQQLENQVQELQQQSQALRNPAQYDPILTAALIDVVFNNVTLNDLSDVDDTGITNGQLLKFNSSSGNYEPANDIDT